MTALLSPPLGSFGFLSYPVATIESVEGVWWGVYCKSRQEKAFVADMRRQEIPAYCPVQSYYGFKDGRRQIIERPVFQGYAFFAAHGGKDSPEYATDIYAAKANSRTVTFLEIKDQKQFVNQLADIERALSINPFLETCGYLVPGSWVRVTRGDFQGFEGLLEKNTKGLVHLRLSFMQQSIVLEIPAEDLEAV